MSEKVLVIVFSGIAIVVTVAWVLAVFFRPDVTAGITVLLTSVIGGCITLVTRAKGAGHSE